ncbi:MAG: hypothetical protein Q7S84_02045 [bacterium]|nr:hypothetical protein [bacterium]
MKRKRSNGPPETEATVPDGLGRRRTVRPSQKRSGVLWAILGVAVTLAVIGVAWFVMTSPLLRVSFEVVGAPPAAHERLISALSALAVAKSPVLAVLGPDHLFVWMGADNAEVRVRVDTMLIAATSKLLFWDRRVTITATVRTIAGVWCAASTSTSPSAGTANNCFGFDEEGILLAQVPRTEGSLILVITDESGTQRVLGQRIMPNPAWVGRMDETLQAITESGEQVLRVMIREQGLHEWEATLASTKLSTGTSGPTLLFSFDFVPQDLAATLRKLKTEVLFEKLTTIDFRIPGRLYYR